MPGAEIERVEKGSLAEKHGIKQGDAILSVNGIEIKDTLDYMFNTCRKNLRLKVKSEGTEKEILIRKKEEEPLGIVFAGVIFDKIKICHNKCDFCFVMQGPPDARETMKIKDDDFRLSFIWGNFISLTNLTETDWKKIEKYRLSPLYISVHATNPLLRSRIFGNEKAGKIMEDLNRLIKNGISVHTQIVLCPNLNDGKELERTVAELSSLYPHVQSIAVVPVGITKYHNKGLRSFKPSELKKNMQLIATMQKNLCRKYGSNFLYISDEFYIKTGTEIPPNAHYGDYPQIENGIGMTRLFLNDYNRGKRFLPEISPTPRKFSIITGILFGKIMKEVSSSFNKIKNVNIIVNIAESIFWGKNVDVAGLLTGTDIIHALKNQKHHTNVLIPAHTLRDEIYFLDGKTIGDVEKQCSCRIIPVEPDYKSLKQIILR